MSGGRTADSSRRATAISSWSPTWWPSESLTSLKRSRSRNRTAAAARRRRALGAADRLVEAVEEQHAVRQAGERVVQRVVLEALLGLLAVGDVGLAADDARRAAGGVAHRHPAREHPAVRAVAVLDPVLVLEVVAGAGEVGVERLRERGAVVGVDAAEPLAAARRRARARRSRASASSAGRSTGGRCGRPSPTGRRWRPACASAWRCSDSARRASACWWVIAYRSARSSRSRLVHVLGDAGLGGRDVGLAVGAVVEQQDGGVRRVGEDLASRARARRSSQSTRNASCGCSSSAARAAVLARHPVDLVARALDRRQRLAHRRGAASSSRWHDEHGDAGPAACSRRLPPAAAPRRRASKR